MGTLTVNVLKRLGVQVSDDELDRRIADELEFLAPLSRPVVDPSNEFTEAELAVLREGGFDPSPLSYAETAQLILATTSMAVIFATALSVKSAAERLRVDGSRIRQRLATRQLYGIRRPTGWALPLFQFEGDHLVPGIERVLPAFDPGLHPLTVQGWLTHPHPDLWLPDDAEERAITPLEWLKTGGDPLRVTELAMDAGVHS